MRRFTWILLLGTAFFLPVTAGLSATSDEPATAQSLSIPKVTLDSKLLSPQAPAVVSAIKLPSITTVTIDGKLLSTQVREIDGKSYVPIEDVAKLLSLSTAVDTKLGVIRLESTPTTVTEPKVDQAKLQAANSVLHALEALQSAVEVGVTQVDYFRKLSDANTEYKRFEGEYTSDELRKAPSYILTFAEHITTALTWYIKAGGAWQRDDTIYRQTYWQLATKDVDEARTALKKQGP